ncbi:glycoside hydrolase family 13 protein [Bifidobacterium aquikefiri]|uniref:glycoside hydrolase family 13 protein n=1 Tax=Bifidobacterium aquikefiri TaxID=1653207 RepID=UPI0039E84BB5
MNDEDVDLLQAPLAHHDGSGCYVSNSRPELGTVVEVSARFADSLHVKSVYVRVVVDGEPQYRKAKVSRHHAETAETWWTVSIDIINTLTSYRFMAQTDRTTLWLNGAGLHEHNIPDAQDFKLSIHHAPHWAKSAVIYQIFPDRFARSRSHPLPPYPQWAIPAEWETPVAANTPDGVHQVYGGSLWGITEKLDYIQGLGANTIYVTPFFPGQSNHRYDASTFECVDPLLGGNEALKTLTAAIHQRGMHLIGDLTLNHTGISHEWFTTGLSQPESPEAGFYYIDRNPPYSYACFNGASSLPKLDHRSPQLRRRLYSGSNSVVARYIRDFGLDGWRIDVAQAAGKYHDIDLGHLVASETRKTMDQTRPDLLLIAEHQFDASAALQGDGWQGIMAYSWFTKPIWAWVGPYQDGNSWGAPGEAESIGGNELAQMMQEYASLIPWQSYITSMNLLDSHDTARFRTISKEFQPLGIALLMTLPGIPSIFSGDEVGVEGNSLEAGRQPFPWDKHQWDVNTYSLYQQLMTLRANHPALQDGGIRWFNSDTNSIIFERADNTETLLIEVSRAPHKPLISTVNGTDVYGGTDLIAGRRMPSEGPSFHIWQVS